jgi:NAD(P)-dependent dehydrogenase (short-subunit alcohol dehydrogenase family)
MGNALLHELLKTGQSVIATTRKPDVLQAELDRTYDHDADILKRALVVGLDISKVEEVKTVFAKAIDKFGRVDVIVNNAGYVGL